MIDFDYLPLFHVVVGQKERGEFICSSGKKIKARLIMIIHDIEDMYFGLETY